jgi:molecular chaperone DnaK
MGKAVGIDLGTTFSAVAIVDKTGRPVIIKNSDGNPITPSVICFTPKGPVAGEEAKEQQALGESNIASFFKRSMGNHNFNLEFNGNHYTPTQLSAIILKKLKLDAQTQLGEEVTHAVITVPAYFNNSQREATREAGQMAGLTVLRIINEPTAAALAYGLDKLAREQTVLVYDLGGGTFDVSLVHISEKLIEVIATDGDYELGGKDWDDRIASYLGQQFENEFGIDPISEEETFQEILIRTEKIKKELSVREKVRVPLVYRGEKGTYELTRHHFEEISRDLMERTISLAKQVLTDKGMTWKDIDGVLLVGGSTRMPMVRQWVEAMSGKKPITGANVDEAVALGAAIQAHTDYAEATGDGGMFTLAAAIRTQDVISHSLGMVAENHDRSRYINSIIIPKNKAVPCAETRPYQIRTRQTHQNSVEVYMLQGESDEPLKCDILGKYVFTDIQHSSTRIAVLDIQYQYDRSGIVTVSAVQRETGKNLPLHIEPVPADMSWLARPPETVTVPQPTIIIAVDISGSMSGKPLAEAKRAAHRFLEDIDLSHASLGLMAFADRVRITQPICQNAKELKNGIELWGRLMQDGEVGWGNSTQPFSETLDLLKDKADPRFLVVLTDGVWSNREGAIKKAKELHEAGVQVIAIGFGGADYEFLRKIATSDENALFTDLKDISGAFSRIARVLTETGGGTANTNEGDGNKGFLRFFKKD